MTPAAKTLRELYGAEAKLTTIAPFARDQCLGLDFEAEEVKDLIDKCDKYAHAESDHSVGIGAECERELENEKELQQEKEMQPDAASPRIETKCDVTSWLVKNEVDRLPDEADVQMIRTWIDFRLQDGPMINEAVDFTAVSATVNFMLTLADHPYLDQYLRFSEWVVIYCGCSGNPTALLVSELEANRLVAAIRQNHEQPKAMVCTWRQLRDAKPALTLGATGFANDWQRVQTAALALFSGETKVPNQEQFMQLFNNDTTSHKAAVESLLRKRGTAAYYDHSPLQESLEALKMSAPVCLQVFW